MLSGMSRVVQGRVAAFCIWFSLRIFGASVCSRDGGAKRREVRFMVCKVEVSSCGFALFSPVMGLLEEACVRGHLPEPQQYAIV